MTNPMPNPNPMSIIMTTAVPEEMSYATMNVEQHLRYRAHYQEPQPLIGLLQHCLYIN